MKGEIARKNELAVLWWSACAVALTAAAAAAAGKAAFVDYYASASSLISSLNGITGDIDRLDLKSGVFSDEDRATWYRMFKEGRSEK